MKEMLPTVESKGGYQPLCKEGEFLDDRDEGVGDWDEDFGQVFTT